MKYSKTILALASVTIFAAHAQSQTPRQPVPASNTPTIAELQQQIAKLRQDLRLHASKLPYRTAKLDCNTGNYEEFLFEIGTLVFNASCVQIEPYLEGHRVTLEVGNPHSFTYSNISGSLYYGRDIDDAFTRNVTVSTTEQLRPGTWTRIQVTVNPSKPEQMRHLELSLRAVSASARK